MTFRQAVDQTSDLRGGWQGGLQALRRVDRKHVGTDATDRLKGSVDVETCLKEKYPRDRQWDYAVGFRPADFNGEVIYWIEVHPAADGEIKVVLAKLEFLQSWLCSAGRKLDVMPWVFIWVSSGKTSFTRTSPQQKRLSQHGLEQKGRFFKIPESFVV
jgi:hypothetical protein